VLPLHYHAHQTQASLWVSMKGELSWLSGMFLTVVHSKYAVAFKKSNQEMLFGGTFQTVLELSPMHAICFRIAL